MFACTYRICMFGLRPPTWHLQMLYDVSFKPSHIAQSRELQHFMRHLPAHVPGVALSALLA